MPQPSERAIGLAKKILAKCMAYDPHFPNPSQATLMAWAELVMINNPSEDDALDAVTKFYATNTDGVKPLPASILTLARQARQDRMARGGYPPPRDRSTDPAPPALPGVEKMPMEEWERRHGRKFPALALGKSLDDPEFTGPNPLRVRCVWCKQPKGEPCVVAGTSQPLKRARAHDVRFAQVEGRCAHTAGWHVDPHTEGCDQFA